MDKFRLDPDDCISEECLETFMSLYKTTDELTDTTSKRVIEWKDRSIIPVGCMRELIVYSKLLYLEIGDDQYLKCSRVDWTFPAKDRSMFETIIDPMVNHKISGKVAVDRYLSKTAGSNIDCVDKQEVQIPRLEDQPKYRYAAFDTIIEGLVGTSPPYNSFSIHIVSSTLVGIIMTITDSDMSAYKASDKTWELIDKNYIIPWFVNLMNKGDKDSDLINTRDTKLVSLMTDNVKQVLKDSLASKDTQHQQTLLKKMTDLGTQIQDLIVQLESMGTLVRRDPDLEEEVYSQPLTQQPSTSTSLTSSVKRDISFD